MSRISIIVLSYLGVFLVTALLLWHPTHLLDTLRLKSEDSVVNFRQAFGLALHPPKGVVIVAIDDQSVHKLGRWPWDRRVMANLFDKLSPAKLVAVDIVFAEPQDQEADAILADSIARNGKIVAGFFGRNDSNITLSPEALDELSISEFRNYTATGESLGIASMRSLNVNVPPILSSPLASAPFNAEPDSDGLYRNYPIGYLYHGLFFCNLALQSWRYATNREISMTVSPQKIETFSEGNRSFTPIDGRFLALNYYDSSFVKIVSAVDVLEGRATEEIKDKVVFLGATEIGIYDMRPTPISSLTPGILLHYTAYANMLDGNFLKKYPYITGIGTSALLICSFLLFWIARFRGRALGYGMLLFGWTFSSFYLMIGHNIVLPLFYPLLFLIIGIIVNESINLFYSEARIKELRKAFSSYVSPELLELISANPDILKLGGEKKEITILFSDIRKFTSLSESMAPDKLLALLNSLLGPMTEEVLRHGGMLDKYIGDAIMALYNVPLNQPNHEAQAARSALAIIEVLHRLNSEKNINLDIGIGIHTGEAIIGNVGSENRFDYTAIGDSVNLSSRLEGLTKMYHAHIIISDSTAQKLDDSFLIRPLDRVRVKGKDNMVIIHELLVSSEENKIIVTKFTDAIEMYYKGDFSVAMEMFDALLPDGPSEIFKERCTNLISMPPLNWDGIWTMVDK